jgi:hypothetical protein
MNSRARTHVKNSKHISRQNNHITNSKNKKILIVVEPIYVSTYFSDMIYENFTHTHTHIFDLNVMKLNRLVIKLSGKNL